MRKGRIDRRSVSERFPTFSDGRKTVALCRRRGMRKGRMDRRSDSERFSTCSDGRKTVVSPREDRGREVGGCYWDMRLRALLVLQGLIWG